jgi:nucleoid-associated protein YgaU
MLLQEVQFNMARYKNNLLLKRTPSGKRYYSTVLPIDPRFSEFPREYTVKAGDRWDQLSYKFYGTPIYWSNLANANDSANGSIFAKPGTIIKIPEI